MDYQLIISLLTLIALEVVLGIDNIIFISILAGKLPPDQQRKARNVGILLAMVMRLGLLAVISVIMKPGAMAFERIPREPNSLAIDLVNPIIPALDAE